MGSGNSAQVQTHQLTSGDDEAHASTIDDKSPESKDWVTFEEEEEEGEDNETTKYERVQQWETFNEDELQNVKKDPLAQVGNN